MIVPWIVFIMEWTSSEQMLYIIWNKSNPGLEIYETKNYTKSDGLWQPTEQERIELKKWGNRDMSCNHPSCRTILNITLHQIHNLLHFTGTVQHHFTSVIQTPQICVKINMPSTLTTVHRRVFFTSFYRERERLWLLYHVRHI